MFGRWKVLRFDCVRHSDAYWVCECSCGTIRSVNGYHLRSGHSTSCGCYAIEIIRVNKPGRTHGLKQGNLRLYRIWQGMLNRCRRPKNKYYRNYGGRGISVCAEWHQFLPFYKWAMANGYTDELTIDRIDVDGNYEPSNCQWLTMSENSKKAAEDRRRKENGVQSICQ